MTSKQKMLSVLSGQRIREENVFPVVIPYLDIFLRDHWREVTEVPWWAVRAWDLNARLQVAKDLQEKLDIDWVPAEVCASRDWRERHSVEVVGERVFLVNDETGNRREVFEPPIGGEQVLVREASVKSREDLARAVPVTSAQSLLTEGYLDYARKVVSQFGSELFVFASISSPFWGTYHCFGFYEMMSNLVERPDLVKDVLERLTVQRLEYLRAYAAMGIHGVWVEDSCSSADMISLEHFRRFAAPYVKALIDEIRELGMKSIYYFCGDVSDRLEDLIAMQPDALSLEDSKKGFVVELEEIDKVLGGRCCLFGNIDAIGIIQNGTTQAMAEEIRRQVAVGRRHERFAISLGSPVTPLTPAAKVREFVQLARELQTEGCL